MNFRHLTSISLFLGISSGWNTDVHNQIGFMAEEFLSPYTASILGQILEPQYNGSIGRAAAWADAYAHTQEGRFSYQWHWIDVHDNPPSSCNLNFTRDCAPGGCVVSAIANQTNILRECIADVESGALTGGTNLTCSYALKWVSHFFGDIAQPLHASERAIGGNLFNVTFGGKIARLHAVWDKWIPYTDANVTAFSTQSIDPFFTALVARIRADKFFEAPYMWLACSDPTTPTECATQWARESNKWTCDYVYGKVDQESDLATNGYTVGAFPIVELQISKAALRLGTWLNKLVGTPETFKHEKQIVLGSTTE
ncbi:phospholipase C/P1 nuclease [Aaosphaeria arxii CBS 175.79]|uniref:Phospholipase C/P1 nuclease n=1 Tax=Aaosphaeria arxii CBS 175.79 TaxID=1450172 RepID=A0A6A5XW30_9PLEO|nr:phospholipase C/P1 nuclease [Aaosphaeria arxii CBS 175.79]KAF2017528.1 phospholipase C/P1 nuclease [Aaosphaeria arxii CBS 175.79]